MLTGIRDRCIDCVVNWSGPTDWFYAMGTEGWTEQELWSEAVDSSTEARVMARTDYWLRSRVVNLLFER